MPTESKLIANIRTRLKGNLRAAGCPSRSVLDHVTSRWGSLVLLLLSEGTKRFSELARDIGGVSEKMLAQTLKALEADGLLLRNVYPTIPPKVEYSLTQLGREAAVHIKSLTDWVEENTPEILEIRSKRVESVTLAPVSDGTDLHPTHRDHAQC